MFLRRQSSEQPANARESTFLENADGKYKTKSITWPASKNHQQQKHQQLLLELLSYLIEWIPNCACLTWHRKPNRLNALTDIKPFRSVPPFPGVQIRFSTDSVKPKMKGWNRFRRQFGVIRPVSAQKNRKFFGYRKTFSISAKPKTEIFSAKPKAENFQQKPKTENFSVMMSHFPFLANNSLSCPLSSDFHHSIKETILRIGNLEKIRNSPENFVSQ